MRRGVAAIGAVLAATVIIERIRSSIGSERGAKGMASKASHHGPEAYCLGCKASRPIQDAQVVVMKDQRTGIRGTCPSCGRGLFSVAPRAA